MIEHPNIYEEFGNLVKQIPSGSVSSYGDVAVQLGDAAASRAVAEMVNELTDADAIPVHRVVPADGSLGGHNSTQGIRRKTRKLMQEGVRISQGRIENFEKIRFTEFKSRFPLLQFREAAKRISLAGKMDYGDSIRAMDISYSGRTGIGVAVDFYDDSRFEIVVKNVKAPYIPNYLYLREGEIYESLVRKGMLNVIDGNGIIHRDGRGVATLVGASRQVATVGIAKSLLIGEERNGYIFYRGRKIGKKLDKFFVSKGFGVEIEECLRLLIREGHFPQTKWADKLSRRYRDEILLAKYSVR